MTQIKISSNRMLITLLICMLPVILLKDISTTEKQTFLYELVSILAGLATSAVLFCLVYLSQKYTKCADVRCLYRKTVVGSFVTALIYCVYFVWLISYILLKYSDMFSKKFNQNASLFGIGLILLIVCAYSSYKGANAIARCAMIISVITAVSLLLIFCGNILNIDLSVADFGFSGNRSGFFDFMSNTFSISFTAVIFLVLQNKSEKFKLRSVLVLFAAAFLIFTAFAFFIRFALGSYAYMQEYPGFLLSKSSLLGSVGGIEGLYLFVSTISVFILVSLCLCCIKKSAFNTNGKHYLLFILPTAILLFCAQNIESVRDVLTNQIILNIMTVVVSLVLPAINLALYRRDTNV